MTREQRSDPFSRTPTGQILLELCLTLGKTPEELGDLRDRYPFSFDFLEEAMKARFTRRP